jgi:hypothetical protein
MADRPVAGPPQQAVLLFMSGLRYSARFRLKHPEFINRSRGEKAR